MFYSRFGLGFIPGSVTCERSLACEKDSLAEQTGGSGTVAWHGLSAPTLAFSGL